jgi:hypothetical protein
MSDRKERYCVQAKGRKRGENGREIKRETVEMLSRDYFIA